MVSRIINSVPRPAVVKMCDECFRRIELAEPIGLGVDDTAVVPVFDKIRPGLTAHFEGDKSAGDEGGESDSERQDGDEAQ